MRAPSDRIEHDQVLALLDLAASCASAAEQWAGLTGDQRHRLIAELGETVFGLHDSTTTYLEVATSDDEVLR